MAGRRVGATWQQLAEAFIGGASFREAAEQLDVSLSTVVRWSRKPELRRLVADARARVREECDHRAVEAAPRALGWLMQIAGDEMGTPAMVRVQAIDRILKRAADAQSLALLVDPAKASDVDWYRAKVESIQAALVATSSDVARQKLMRDLDLARTQLVGAMRAGGAEVSDDERHQALQAYVDNAPIADLRVLADALRRRGIV